MIPEKLLIYKHVGATCLHLVLIFLVVGCVTHKPMPEAVYGEQSTRLFADVPDKLKAPEVDILYATDRALDEDSGVLLYGHERSFSLAFGIARVDLDKDISWDDLVAWTTTQTPAPEAIKPEVESVTELTRLPPTPYKYTLGEGGGLVLDPDIADKRADIQKEIQGTIKERLALTERKQVYMHIHGIKEPFEDPLILMAMSYHVYGRQGVPVVYSWPAGEPGLLRGYTRDRESGEFTIYHLKDFIRTVAAMDEVEQINISAHSRGTDVVLTALRELVIEARASGVDPRGTFKIANLVLLAPDLDVDVTSQRAMAEGLHFAVGRVTIYVNQHDVALALSQQLFASEKRLGEFDPSEITDAQKERMEAAKNIDVIFYSGEEGGSLGHSYYQAPVILADIFLLYDGKLPGSRHGRPLEQLDNSMWVIDDSYLQ
ncbi:MAG: alpha/beta hydrolase [Arenicellales bacterium]|nr:alpha/beta hydrolase [Arenicellales bacterium]